MISVIIPTWNEAPNLPSTLERVVSFKPAHEILVVDAGSNDNTPSIAAASGARVINSPVRQRAAQMNTGASLATGDIFLFLHADTILPQRAFERIEEAMANPKVVGGAFRRYFSSESIFLQITCRLAAFRNAVVGWHLGDQAMFASVKFFQRLEGFRLMDRFEDLDFSRRLGKAGKLATIPNPVLSSDRRFSQRGAIKTTMTDFWWTAKFLASDQRVCFNPQLRNSDL